MKARLLMVLAVLGAAPASAGIADSPLPVLVAGETTQHVYSVPFVPGGPGMATIFACTSTDTVPIQVCVEVFGAAGGAPISNDCSSTSLSVAPGATARIGTGATASFSLASIVGGSPSGGSARILATSKKLLCMAFHVDAANAPPTSMVQLTIVKGTKQKAAN